MKKSKKFFLFISGLILASIILIVVYLGLSQQEEPIKWIDIDVDIEKELSNNKHYEQKN